MHNFQRRLCWMLSSFCQQDGGMPGFTFNIASLRNNGAPTTELVIAHFRDKINIKHTIFEENERDIFAISSLVKERQVKNSSCEWIYKLDGDYVFPPDFYKRMTEDLDKQSNCETCVGSKARINTMPKPTTELINGTSGFYIDNVFEKSKTLPVRDVMENFKGSPGPIIAFRREIFNKKLQGKYNKTNLDFNLFKRGMHVKGEPTFRHRMGGTVRCDWPTYIHLNHIRDEDVGTHTEEQR